MERESERTSKAGIRRGRGVTCALLGLLAACVGDVSDPDRFGDGTYCPEDFEIETLFERRCAGGACHGADAVAGNLDLVSPGFAERMIGVRSEICDWAPLVVPGNAEESFLYVKVTNPPLSCGEPMPPVGYLTNNEVRCVRDWIESLAEPEPEAPPEDEGDASEGEEP